MIRFQLYIKGWLGLLFIAVGLAGCNFPGRGPAVTPLVPPGVPSVAPTSSLAPGAAAQAETPAAPSAAPTEEAPLAARGRGMQVILADYQIEAAQAQAAKGAELTPEDRQRVLDELIDQTLLAQAAVEQGFTADDALLQNRTQRLSEQLGGPPALEAWMAAHGYDAQTFRAALARAAAAAWMRDQIAAGTPAVAEQVHVRQILLYNADTANEVLSQIRAGNDFGNLAVKYDPITRGDLGWFPRGYLLDPKLEAAAFALQPNAVSDVIQTLAGYQILQLLERDAQRPLLPEMRLALQTQAVQAWLQQRRSQAQIQTLLP